MASDSGNTANNDSQDPYFLLGLESGASFDLVQQARDRKLLEVGDDPRAKAKIEASYDALLMASLKERQLGKASNAAVNASQRESKINDIQKGNGVASTLLTRLKGLNPIDSEESSNKLVVGQGGAIRFSLGLLALVLLLISPSGSIELILSLSTIGVFISQVRRGRKIFSALGWSVVLLSIGLIVGGLIVGDVHTQNYLNSPFTSDQLEAIPALLLLWGGALLLG